MKERLLACKIHADVDTAAHRHGLDIGRDLHGAAAALVVLVLMPAGKMGERQAVDIARTDGLIADPAVD